METITTDHSDYFGEHYPTHETDARYSKGARQQAPRNLRALHHEIIRLTLLGWKGTEVAKYLQVTPVTVSNCLASDKARNVLRLLTQKRTEASVDLQQIMMNNAPVVHDVLFEGIMDPDTPITVRMKEAREYLGICGFVKPQKIQAQSLHAHLTLDEIKEIKARALSRAREAGLLFEGEGSDESEGSSMVVDVEVVEQESVSSCSNDEPEYGGGLANVLTTGD